MGIKSWMYRFCFKKTVDVSQAEIEQITTELIEETRNILQKRFDAMMGSSASNFAWFDKRSNF